MTASIEATFAGLGAERRAAWIPYWMSGFPTRARSLEIARILLESADLLEIGLPFSDPLADGPIIQAAGTEALRQGTTLRTALEDVATLCREFPDKPLLLMSYVNPLRAYGLERSARESRKVGLVGWIVPDLDLTRRGEIDRPVREYGLDLVPLVAPTSPAARIRQVVRGASGFVYLVAVTGVTGAGRGTATPLRRYAATVRRETDLPLCVGFGISAGAQAREATRHCQGVIVGSALIEPFLGRAYDRARATLRRRIREIVGGLRTAESSPD